MSARLVALTSYGQQRDRERVSYDDLRRAFDL
jgi:hypothetical protein